MFKRKSENQITPAFEYWNQKLNMEFTSEFARYKYLCVNTSKRNYKLIKGEQHRTYHTWKNYISNKLKKLSPEELSEFYYFLNSKVRSSSIIADLNGSFMITFVFSFYVPLYINAILNYINKIFTTPSPGYKLLLNAILITAIALLFGLSLIHILKDDCLKRYYYQDLLCIVESTLSTSSK